MFGIAKRKIKETPQQAIKRLLKKIYTNEVECRLLLPKLGFVLNELLKSENERERRARKYATEAVNGSLNLNLGYLRNAILALKDLVGYMNNKEKREYMRLKLVAEELGKKRRELLDSFKKKA